MAKRITKIRTALYGLALCAAFIPAASGQEFGTPHGTTQGMLRPNPEWSLGLQIGSLESTGLSAQKMGFAGGAANFGLGFWAGDLSLSADYLWFVGQSFASERVPDGAGYSPNRGHLRPYVGLGAQIGEGIFFRAPVGLQYTLLKDPVNVFGGLTLLVGRHMAFRHYIIVDLGIAIGVRLLM